MHPDPAFVWESQRAGNEQAPATSERIQIDLRQEPGDWVPLRRAHELTGAPMSALRTWARKGKVPSKLIDGPEGSLRLIGLAAVRARMTQPPRQSATYVPSRSVVAPQPAPSVTWVTETAPTIMPETSRVEAAPPLVVGQASAANGEQANAPAPATPPPSEAAVPDGSILVPLDAWNRLLVQLGNLHLAGQQLAEARERAGKAETEAEFLRERVRDLKDRLASAQAEALLAATATEAEPSASTAPTGKTRWRHYYDLARSLRRQ